MSKKKEIKVDHEMFKKEIGELCRKYELVNCSFCGDNKDGKMIGSFCVEREGLKCNVNHLIQSAFNVSRLYQAAREHLFMAMDGKKI